MTAQKIRSKQIWFMPWADLKKPVTLGGCLIWPVTDDALQTKFPDASVRDQLKQYFSCYVDLDGRPVETIAVCTYGNRNVSKMRQQEEQEIRLGVDVLAFAVISRGYRALVRNKNSSPASADRFKLLVQNFVPGNDFVAVHAGRCISGGWRIGQITFPRPWCLGGPFQQPDEWLLGACAKIFADDFSEDLKRQLSKGLEWFRLAQTDSDDVTDETKVVMMATALEALLAVPKDADDKQLWIANWLDSNCSYSKSERRKWTGAHSQEHSAIGCWSRSFYDLRNSIVHGDVARTLMYPIGNGKEAPQLQIAALVFWECVVRKLFEANCFPSERETIRNVLADCTEDENDQYQHLLMMFLGIDDIHKSYGWLPSLANRSSENESNGTQKDN